MENETDLNVLRTELKNIHNLIYSSAEKPQQHESITPEANKGKLTEESQKDFCEKVTKKLYEHKKRIEQTKFFSEIGYNSDKLNVFRSKLIREEKNLDGLKSNKIFIQKFQSTDTLSIEVIRFGINLGLDIVNDLELKNDIANYNSCLKNGYNQIIKNCKTDKDKIMQVYENGIELTKIECLVLKYATLYLETSSNNVTLVSFFKREQNEGEKKDLIIGRIEENKIELHTTILYKTENDILVIDPNNLSFSSFLKNFKESKFTIETFFSRSDKNKIYMPKNPTGRNSDQFRNCVDISIKLCFVLNTSKTKYQSVKEIIKSEEVKYITNNNYIAKCNLKNIYSEYPSLMRSRQASSIDEIQSSNMKLKEYDNKLKNNLYESKRNGTLLNNI